MSNVVTLLARLAESAHPVTDAEIRDLAGTADASLRQALLARDAEAVRAIAGATGNVACLVFAPDESDEPLPLRQPDEDEPDSDTDSDSDAGSQAA